MFTIKSSMCSREEPTKRRRSKFHWIRRHLGLSKSTSGLGVTQIYWNMVWANCPVAATHSSSTISNLISVKEFGLLHLGTCQNTFQAYTPVYLSSWCALGSIGSILALENDFVFSSRVG